MTKAPVKKKEKPIANRAQNVRWRLFAAGLLLMLFWPALASGLLPRFAENPDDIDWEFCLICMPIGFHVWFFFSKHEDFGDRLFEFFEIFGGFDEWALIGLLALPWFAVAALPLISDWSRRKALLFLIQGLYSAIQAGFTCWLVADDFL